MNFCSNLKMINILLLGCLCGDDSKLDMKAPIEKRFFCNKPFVQ